MVTNYPVIEEPALNISSMACYPYSPQLEGRFWFESKYEDGAPINLSFRHGNRLYVPRNCATIGRDTKIEWTDGYPLTSPVKLRPGVAPRDAAQERVLFESNAWLDQGRSHIIKASTAIGKTFLGCTLAAWSGVPTLVVVPKTDLITGKDQWLDAVNKFLNVKPEEVGIIRQNKCEVKGKKIVLAMVHSLSKDKYPDWIKDYFGLVIFDEVQRMAADTFHLVAGMFRARLRLGLTADTRRPDGRAFVFEAHIGPVMVEAQQVKMKPKVLVCKSGVMLPRKKQWNPKTKSWEIRVIPHSPGKMPHIIKILTRNQQRNGLMVDFVLEAYETGRIVLGLSDLARDKYLNAFREMLIVRGIPSKDIGFYVSGMTPKQLEEHKLRRIVLGTYGMCGEGTNVPQWDSLAMLTPRSNIKQPLGRVLRELQGKKQPVILDVVDEDSWVCVQYAENRLRVYQSDEIGATVEFLG